MSQRELDEFVSAYGRFEKSVQELLGKLFKGDCEWCTACCCEVHLCEETERSVFLQRLLNRQGLKQSEMDPKYGWLESFGCRLEYGRPPVCYAYFCDELLNKFPEEEQRRAVLLLGSLPEYIGRNAFGELHLTEEGDAQRFERVDVERLFERLAVAEEVFQVILTHMQENGRKFSPRERAVLDLIEPAVL